MRLEQYSTKEPGLNMRKFFLAVMMTLVFASTALAVDDCKAIPWGAPISAVEEITFSHAAGGVKFYKVIKVEPCGVFKIQGANVTYGFREGKLFTVLVEIDKARDVKEVVSTLMDTYGLPDHKKSDGWDEYRWETDDLKIKLKSQFSTDRIKIGMYYKPLIPQD